VLPRTAELTGAFVLNTPLAMPAAIDDTVPRLIPAVDGDPATPIQLAN
jgi:hypothetical protein